MRPIEVILPPGSLLDPYEDAAVVGKLKEISID
jgi:N-methylhydantoinase B/oxoprolinase/acetone carboxylase alpha subunit